MHQKNRGRLVAVRLKRTLPLLLLLLLPAVRTGAAGQASPVAELQLLADEAYYPALLNRVRNAQKSIDLVMYLWKITDATDNRPAELLRALGEAGRRGVRVRVILENSEYDEKLNRSNRETARSLRREGIDVIFDSPSVTTHTKLVVIDHRFCFVGSHNLTQSALERNHELSITLDDPRLAGKLEAYVNKLLVKH